MILLQNKKLFLSLLFVVLLLVLSSVISSLFSPPKIKSVSPENGSTNISASSKIIITFEKNIHQGQFSIKFSPPVDYTENINNNILTFSPKPYLQQGKTYTITLFDKNGSPIISGAFTTTPPQGSPETDQEAEDVAKNYYPLAGNKPPDNANFYFVYTDRLKLKVYLKGNQTESKQEFLNFAKEKWVDLSKHQITYVSPP